MQTERVLYGYEVDLASDTTAAKICRLIGSDKEVLEVGCAVGHQTNCLVRRLNCRVTGVEVDADAARSAAPYCEQLIVGDIEKGALDQLPAGKLFDVVVFADVLEHLRDPGKLLKKIKSLLRSSGFVVCSVPNIVHASVIFEMANGRFDYQSSGLLDHTHLRFFTRKSIYELFAESGYDVQEIQTSELPPERTEFGTIAITEEDRLFLNYIQQHNVDSNVYQYILKAAVSERMAEANLRVLRAEETAKKLAMALSAAQRRMQRLESNLSWITNRTGYRFLRATKHLLSPANWRRAITKILR